ncbi:hypothetical protein ACLB2K_014769 [Fragaria x ananassa]
MEGGERVGSGGTRYTLRPERISNEDILFCVDVDPECVSEMRPGPNGRALTRLESVKQAILLFINAKLTINPEHRFAFSVLSKSASWIRKEFNSDVESAKAAFRAMYATSSTGHADLTTLFRMAAHEAKKSRVQKRILRVILIYCRSSLQPQHQWPVNQKIFTMDVLYLHDKPGPDNCPQLVYDKLVEALEHVTEFEGYILESGQGLSRTLFRHMSMLLSHPQQRCSQDYLDIPRSIAKRLPADSTPSDDSISVSSQ